MKSILLLPNCGKTLHLIFICLFVGGCSTNDPSIKEKTNRDTCTSYCNQQVKCISETENPEMEIITCEKQCINTIERSDNDCAEATIDSFLCRSKIDCSKFIDAIGCETELDMEASQCGE